MTVPGEQHVVVEREDAAVVTADVLVIPSNSRGTFGEPWLSIVRGFGLAHPQPPIPFADISVKQVDPARSSRIRYVAFAATVDDRSTTTQAVIAKIGAALGKLTMTPRTPPHSMRE